MPIPRIQVSRGGGLDVDQTIGSPALAAPLGKDSLDGRLGVFVEGQGSWAGMAALFSHSKVAKRLVRKTI